jgi:hypothetical protein
MDDLIPFKDGGDIKLTVPLSPEFRRILQEFVRATVIKSGFSGEDSGRIAERISSRAFQDFPLAEAQANHQRIELLLAHRPGQITIKTAIPGLNFSEEEEFKSD